MLHFMMHRCKYSFQMGETNVMMKHLRYLGRKYSKMHKEGPLHVKMILLISRVMYTQCKLKAGLSKVRKFKGVKAKNKFYVVLLVFCR